MSGSGQDARGTAGPDSPTPDRDNQMAMGLVGLAVVRHMLANRRLYERVAVAVIVLAALRKAGRENAATTMARLVAWNERQVKRLERKAAGKH
jgi:hypothetical protein